MKKRRFLFSKVSITLAIGIFLLHPTTAHAGYWGEPTAANMMLFNLEQIAEKIQGVTLSIVKNAALQTINQQVIGMVNGAWGQGSLIIEDWEDFIYTQSSKKAESVVIKDFFPKMFDGKGSGSNYIPSSEGVNAVNSLNSSINTIKNYPEYLKTIGKNTIAELQSDITQYTLDQVCPDPQGSLSKGDYACFSAVMKPQNNPRGIPILTERKFLEEKLRNEKIAETQAGITGYKPQTNDAGLVVTPPQTIADIVSTVQTLPAMAMAVAENPEELITGVIQAYVNSLIQKTLSKVGLGPIGASFSQNLGNELSRESDQLISDGIGEMFHSPGMGTDIVGPNNVGKSSTKGYSGLEKSSSGPK